MDIQNPEEEIDKSFKEEVKLEKLKLLAQIEIAQEMKKLGIDPSQLPGADQQQGGGKGKGKGGGGKQEGRPPSGKKAPQIKQKGSAGGEPRTTVTES